MRAGVHSESQKRGLEAWTGQKKTGKKERKEGKKERRERGKERTQSHLLICKSTHLPAWVPECSASPPAINAPSLILLEGDPVGAGVFHLFSSTQNFASAVIPSPLQIHVLVIPISIHPCCAVVQSAGALGKSFTIHKTLADLALGSFHLPFSSLHLGLTGLTSHSWNAVSSPLCAFALAVPALGVLFSRSSRGLLLHRIQTVL